MRKVAALAILVAVVALPARAQTEYPPEVLESYWECMERHDLDNVDQLVWYHHNVERVDASIYGLPVDDFDDRSRLTIAERLRFRAEKEALGVRLATSGPVQYPHHLRPALDQQYLVSGERPDCSAILTDAGVEPPPVEDVGSGWATDLNLTAADSVDRGEVDIVVDRGNPGRVFATSCPAGGGEVSNHFAASDDWGQSWTSGQAGLNSGTTWECDPVSFYQRSTGRVYHGKIACTGGCSSTHTMLRYSADNGATWTDCARPGNDSSEDREWLVIDNTPGSACYGNIYATWHNLNQEKVVRSTDSCASWSNLTNLTSVYQAITPDINVAADGHVFVTWQNHGDATFKLAGSSDCGATWTSPPAGTIKARNGDWKNHIPAQCQRGIATLPTVDVDRAPGSAFYGRVYVAFFDFNQSGCGDGPGCNGWTSNCNYDVWLIYSDSNGQTWSSPVNLTAGDGVQVDNFMGYMRVDEADGSIYIGYHRTRLNPTSLADRQKTHFFITRSIDGGSTWEQPFQASTLEGDERVGGASSFERGDYNRIDVFQGVVWPVWVDRRDSGGEEEIVVRKVCSEAAHWSERAPTFTAPPTDALAIGNKIIEVSWDLPDIYWGDGGEDPAARSFELWVDGSLEEGGIPAAATSTLYTADDCATPHSLVVRAVNQCGIAKDYAAATMTATGCCENNPDVNVTPDGPVTECVGTPVLLTANLSGGVGPFEYQWYRDGVPIPGATTATYSAADADSHAYTCQVKGGGCADFSIDPYPTTVDWVAAPIFAGIESVTNPGADTCTLDLRWSAATTVCPGPVRYNVYRSTTSGFTPDASNQVASEVGGTSYSDAVALVDDVDYYYVVRAVDRSTGGEETNMVEGWGAPTGPITAMPWFDDAGDTGSAQLALDEPWVIRIGAGTGGSDGYRISPYSNSSCAAMTTPTMALAPNAEVRFWSKYDIQPSLDKGVVQVSTDGGSSWSRVPVDYPGTSTQGGDACGLPADTYFTGQGPAYTEYSGSLAAWAQQDVQLRWLFSTDGSITAGGWWVDDITISDTADYAVCTSVADPPMFADGFESGDSSAWDETTP